MINTLLLVALVATLAPLVAALLRPVIRIPLVVLEIIFGLLIGPAALGLVSDLTLVSQLSEFGLVMLFFMAGSEINFREISGRPLRRSAVGWLISILVGVAIGILLAPDVPAGVYVGVALSSTALGTLLPILIDAGELRTPFGIAVTAVGALGEFGPLVAISVFLSSRNPGRSTVILIAFVVIALGAVILAARGQHLRIHGLISATLHTSGQFAVRLIILVIIALVALSVVLGLDLLLGAFAGGVVVQYLLSGGRPEDSALVRSKLDAVAFGVFVPIFFVYTGITFDLPALLDDPKSLVLVGIFLVLMLVVRGIPGLLSAPTGAPAATRRALLLMSATGLPIIVAVTQIGVERGELSGATAAAMVGAGMLSVLLFPLLAMATLSTSAPTEPDPEILDPDLVEDE